MPAVHIWKPVIFSQNLMLLLVPNDAIANLTQLTGHATLYLEHKPQEEAQRRAGHGVCMFLDDELMA